MSEWGFLFFLSLALLCNFPLYFQKVNLEGAQFVCVRARMRSAWKGKSEEKAAIARLCAPPSLPHTKGPDRPPKGPLKKLQMRPPARLPFTPTAETTNKASISI